MSFQTFVTEKLASLTAMMNAISTNAKTIEELTAQNVIDPLSKIHVSKNGQSQSLKLQQILDVYEISATKELLSVGNITLSGNQLIFTDIVWKIGGIQFLKSQTVVIPFASSGFRREDIFVGDNSGNIVRIAGVENEVITITPILPSLAVFITKNIVTDSVVQAPTAPIIQYPKDIQIAVSTSSNVSPLWNKNTLIINANCTITVPSALFNEVSFAFIIKIGVTVNWVITSPFVNYLETPLQMTGRKSNSKGYFLRELSTSNIHLEF